MRRGSKIVPIFILISNLHSKCGKSCNFLIKNAHVPCTSLSSPWYELSRQKRAKLGISQLETNFPVGRKDDALTIFFSISKKQIIKHLEQPKRALEIRYINWFIFGSKRNKFGVLYRDLVPAVNVFVNDLYNLFKCAKVYINYASFVWNKTNSSTYRYPVHFSKINPISARWSQSWPWLLWHYIVVKCLV
jgi:hypothetical protein